MNRSAYKKLWIFKEPGRECRNTVQMHDPTLQEIPPEYMFGDTIRALVESYGAKFWPTTMDATASTNTRDSAKLVLRRDLFALSSAINYIMTPSSWFFWCAFLSTR